MNAPLHPTAAMAATGATTANAPTTAADPAAERLALRAALGRYATGVTIITCRGPDGARVGLTANSFSALSLDPPLVLWSLRQASSSLAPFAAAAGFAVNVLAEDQAELSRRFASSVADKFHQGDWTDGAHGAPVLAGCTAVFECTLTHQQPAGDHVLFIGRVQRHSHAPELPALVFHAGHYHAVGDRL